MGYLGELRTNWRAVSAAAIGLGAGLLLNTYIVSLFAPHLLAEFGWTKAQFALISVAPMIMLICLPLVGRLTDLFGVKRIATVGIVTMPLTFLGLSAAGSDIREYFALYVVQMVMGAATSSTVYCRIVAERFTQARGLALAIAASGPAIIGAVGGPLLSNFIDAHGWRAGYQAVAMFTAVLGAVAWFMIPKSESAPASLVAKPKRRASQDYPLIARSVAFWLIAIGMVLCNLPQALHSAQMKLVLMENGATSIAASMLISMYSVGVIIGRFGCGLALDRVPTHIVAGVCMGLPSIGMVLIASTFDTPIVLALAVLLVGFSQGAEGDVLGFIVVKYFGLEIYSSVLGLLTAMLSAATAAGAVLLSFTLRLTDTFTLFVSIGAFVTVLGGGLLFLLGRVPTADSKQELATSPETQLATSN